MFDFDSSSSYTTLYFFWDCLFFVLQSLIVCVIAMLKPACFILQNMYMYSWAWRNIRDRVSSGLRDAKTFA